MLPDFTAATTSSKCTGLGASSSSRKAQIRKELDESGDWPAVESFVVTGGQGSRVRHPESQQRLPMVMHAVAERAQTCACCVRYWHWQLARFPVEILLANEAGGYCCSRTG